MTGFGPLADLSRPLSEREFDELTDALNALPEDRESFDLPMLEGYLVGVLLQPEVVLPSKWLPPIFAADEGEPMVPGDEAQVTRVLQLVMRHHNTLAAHIAAREPFEPVVWSVETSDGSVPTREQELAAIWTWALGFREALERFPALLELADREPDLDEPLAQVYRHIPLDPEVNDEAMQEARLLHERLDHEDPIESLDDALDRIVVAVLDVADVSRRREPTVRAQPKVGRNDPCPCGSGRKYKQCHGREVS